MQRSVVGNQDFRGDDASRWWITLIDPYRGREPLRCNYEFFRDGRRPILMYPMVMLDSQVVDALYSYITSPDKMDVSRREAVRRFLFFVMECEFDLSPFFYYVEKAAKSAADTYEHYATERAKTIFTLHTMDRQHFLEIGEIVHDLKQVPWYLEDRKVGSVDELISKYAARRDDLVELGFGPLADAIYGSLLRIVLVEYQVSGSVQEKYRVMLDFMGRILGVVLGQELWLSLMYFAQPQRYSRFIPLLQPGMNFQNLRRALRASAWDLILMHLPWLLLRTNMRSILVGYQCCLTYVCTAEHAIRDIMKLLNIEYVFESGDTGRMHPIISYDENILNEILGEGVVKEIQNDHFMWRTSRALDRELKRPLSPDGVSNVIAFLEAEATRICERGIY